MRPFLTSSCVSPNLREPFLAFLGKDPSSVRLYFIPTATDVEDDKTYTVKSMEDFAAIGINPIWYSLQHKTQDVIAQELADADVIWVGGGNTFYLLDVARKTGFLHVVTDLVLHRNVVYGGTSAGTLLASPTIEAASWGDGDPNDVGLTDESSLNFVPFFTHVHHNPSTDRDMLQKHSTKTIYALQDTSALAVVDEKVTMLGDVEMFNT